MRPIGPSRRYRRRWSATKLSQVPATNSVLLGAVPGELFLTHPRPNLRGARCLGVPPFDPVWALPPQPLHCDKRANRILLVAAVAAAPSSACSDRVTNRRDLVRWCQLILDASRKGLAVEPASPTVDNSWREYKRLAPGAVEEVAVSLEHLLLRLSIKKQGSWSQFRSAVEELCTERDFRSPEMGDEWERTATAGFKPSCLPASSLRLAALGPRRVLLEPGRPRLACCPTHIGPAFPDTRRSSALRSAFSGPAA